MFVIHWRSAYSIAYGEIAQQTARLIKIVYQEQYRSRFYAYGRQIDKSEALCIVATEQEANAICTIINGIVNRQADEMSALRAQHRSELDMLLSEIRQKIQEKI